MSSADEPTTTLPFVDEHHVTVAASPAVVWEQLGDSLRRQARRGGWYAQLVGADPRRAEGDPLTRGATIPGFTVAEAVPGERLVLAGRHRFSDYRLTFTLVEHGGATHLGARTDAAFPGLGKAYRALVIGSGGHGILVRRWLRRIGAAAESANR